MKKKEKVFYCTIMALCPDLIPTTLFSLVSECDGTVKDFNDLFAIFMDLFILSCCFSFLSYHFLCFGREDFVVENLVILVQVFCGI
jgi:hypothetical protein